MVKRVRAEGLPTVLQASSSQAEEDDFSGGAWAAMKAEMGLDERNPSCFLHSCSVVMVLRKVSGWRQALARKGEAMTRCCFLMTHSTKTTNALLPLPVGAEPRLISGLVFWGGVRQRLLTLDSPAAGSSSFPSGMNQSVVLPPTSASPTDSLLWCSSLPCC